MLTAHQQRPSDLAGKRAEQFVEPETMTHDRRVARIGGDEMMLRDTDRVIVAHASRHLARDQTQQRSIDIAPARKPSQAMDVKLRIARPLIGDQHGDRLDDVGTQCFRHADRQRRRRAVVDTGEIGEQEAK